MMIAQPLAAQPETAEGPQRVGKRSFAGGGGAVGCPLPLRLLAGRFARHGRRRFPTGDRLRRSVLGSAAVRTRIVC